MNIAEWEDRIDDLWRRAGELTPERLLSEIAALTAECPHADGTADFERAGAHDHLDDPDTAIPLYRAALRDGLTGDRHRFAVIQLASSLRNVGSAAEGVDLLTAELDRRSDEYDDAVRAFLSLALIDLGRGREAVATALTALRPHLPAYGRALGEYIALLDGEPETAD
ncbi:tetratricopeptide repeat protein [Stackebrandtia albiflava]|uniref:Tetratricopeptide repeat protein n=1 Tax=Stackebrandtia albiflava TaxID=406432 RepID=A0A562VAT9_9ACTN|nr:tetratricopeptide repeat protein [Stackebrandtia albiflava]TWJ15000.1 tetratricopeptide repeat protein [Stackebrandtia albiflava]